jgi:hypothetical protein
LALVLKNEKIHDSKNMAKTIKKIKTLMGKHLKIHSVGEQKRQRIIFDMARRKMGDVR